MNEVIVLSLVCLTLAWATSSSENKDPWANGENSDDPNMQTRNRRWISEIPTNNPSYSRLAANRPAGLASEGPLPNPFLYADTSVDDIFKRAATEISDLFGGMTKTSSSVYSPDPPPSPVTQPSTPSVLPNSSEELEDLLNQVKKPKESTSANNASNLVGGTTKPSSHSPDPLPSPVTQPSTLTDKPKETSNFSDELIDFLNQVKESTSAKNPSNLFGGTTRPSGDLPSSNDSSGEQHDVAGDNQNECRCGEYQRREGRIIGGWETMNNYKWLGGLRKITIPILKIYSPVFCMLSAYTPRHMITAAHCLEHDPPVNLIVHIGAHNQRITVDGELIQVIETILHPEYIIAGKSCDGNDIGILTLEHEIDMMKRGIVCLFRSNDDELAGQQLKIIGWGFDKEGNMPDLLQEGVTQYLPYNTCSQMGLTLDKKNQFCMTANTQMVTKGDSGGAVLWEDPETLLAYAVGVVSCRKSTNKPTVNIRISAFLPWIEESIKESKSPNTNMCAFRKPMPVH